MTLPAAFITKYQELLGDQAPAFFDSFNQPVQKGYRLNPLKDLRAFQATNQDDPIPYGHWGYYGAVDGHSVAHVTGVQYSQEPSAQYVGEVLAPQPGERVLDLAAAPGGKTTHLAAFMQGQGLLWANEIFYNRAKILSENVERLGIQNAVVSSQTPAELAARFPGYFDKILLDAPCSGEGMFRKDPHAMQYWHDQYPLECSQRQEEILTEAVKMLKPGGIMVYSTCTFAPEEDEQILAWLLKTYPDCHLLAIEKVSGIADGRPEWADDNPELAKTARLWPDQMIGEGHFVARLQKAETAAETALPATMQPAKLSRSKVDLLTEFWQTTMQNFTLDWQRLVLFGDRVFLVPKDCPDLAGLKILRAGIALGNFKKNRFEPDHALALAISPEQATQTYALNTDDWAKYVHGDVVTTNISLTKGWVLMTAAGNGVGWAKYVNGQLKNFFPKGLRFAV